MLSPRIWKIARYVVAGTTAALCNLSILFTLVHFFHLHYLIASVLSFIGSIGAGFLLQKFWTFRDQASTGTHLQLVLYIGVTTINLGINTALMYLFVSVLGIWYLAAQVLAGVCIAVTGYFGYQNLVFKPASSPQ